MPRHRLVGKAGVLLAWLAAIGCGSRSTPASRPSAELSAPAKSGPAKSGKSRP